MEETILISYLNDFIFCPVSIYFHKLYGNLNKNLYQSEYQINGTNAHKAVDNKTYSTRKNILQGIDVYSQKYGIEGKIDIFDINKAELVERKNKIVQIYDGYVFQIYAQYYGLTEMGYKVKKLSLYSMSDNKKYAIKLPTDNLEMKTKFEKLVQDIYGFDIYKGNLHKEFYKRKSLVCDIIEPFRPIVDYKIRKCINLKQLDNYKYTIDNGQYHIEWKDGANFMLLILEAINEYKKEIFEYIQQYYRWIMKEKEIYDFPKVVLTNDIDKL